MVRRGGAALQQSRGLQRHRPLHKI